MTSEYISVADTAKLIRTALKRAFPSVKFSVRSRSYAGGASIDVTWTDGPTSQQVDAIAKRYQGADFDGMIDLKTQNDHFLMPDGSAVLADREGTTASRGVIEPEHHMKPHPDARRVRFGANFVFCSRRESPAFLAAFRAAWRALPEHDRFALLSKTNAWHAARTTPKSWHVDDELVDFGTDADAVFHCMARQVPA